jgi:excisionase family DNA binding protein
MWLKVEQAAELLSCSKKHIVRMVDSGRLEFIDIGLGTAKRELRVKLPESQMVTQQQPPSRKRKPIRTRFTEIGFLQETSRTPK